MEFWLRHVHSGRGSRNIVLCRILRPQRFPAIGRPELCRRLPCPPALRLTPAGVSPERWWAETAPACSPADRTGADRSPRRRNEQQKSNFFIFSDWVTFQSWKIILTQEEHPPTCVLRRTTLKFICSIPAPHSAHVVVVVAVEAAAAAAVVVAAVVVAVVVTVVLPHRPWW